MATDMDRWAMFLKLSLHVEAWRGGSNSVQHLAAPTCGSPGLSMPLHTDSSQGQCHTSVMKGFASGCVDE